MTGELHEWLAASDQLAATQAQVATLEKQLMSLRGEHNRQIELLKRRLIAEPATFRQMFIDDGMNAVMWEFSQDELGADFVKELWKVLLREAWEQRFCDALGWAGRRDGVGGPSTGSGPTGARKAPRTQRMGKAPLRGPGEQHFPHSLAGGGRETGRSRADSTPADPK